jgi:protein-tyrosine kinase
VTFYSKHAPDQVNFAMDEDAARRSRDHRQSDRASDDSGPAPERGVAETDPRSGCNSRTPIQPLAVVNPARVWESLTAVTLNDETLARNGLFTDSGQSHAGPIFDILRTRISQAMAEKGWRRIGVTAPTRGCGTSFTAANLALSLARRPGSRVVLIDLDLRQPGLHSLLGLTPVAALQDVIVGTQPVESLFVRVGQSLAIGLNANTVPNASDVLQGPNTVQALDALDTRLAPEIIVMDLPPTLMGDDVIAMAGKLDAVLIVADATRTTARDMRACEMLLENRIPIMGVVLNRAQDRGLGRQRYGKE